MLSPERNPSHCSATIRTDLSYNHKRDNGHFFTTRKERMGHGISKDYNKITINNPLRGDDYTDNKTCRVFLWDSYNPENSFVTVSVSYLNWRNILRDKNHVMAKHLPTGELVKALTVDGHGGHLSIRDKVHIDACPWFYLEQSFPVPPRLVYLRRMNLHTDGHADLVKDRQVTQTQSACLGRWYYGTYLPEVIQSPTGKPITERYYHDLQEMDFPKNDKKDLAVKIFGASLLQQLERNHDRIMKRIGTNAA